MPERTRKYPSQYLLGKLEGALSDDQERARNRKFEKVRLVEQHRGCTRGDARLDRGMQETILVPSSASDVGAAPADQNKEEWLLEQQGGHTRGDARLDRGMLETILVPSSASDVGAAPADQNKEEQLMEQQGGRTRGDARLDRGMLETILVPSSASDVGAAPADQNKEEQLLEQQGGRTRGDAWLDRWMLETILVPSSASDVNAASTDLFVGNIGREKQYHARQFEDVKNTGWEVGHWSWKHQRQKLGMEPTQKTQEAFVPQKSPRCDQPPDDYG